MLKKRRKPSSPNDLELLEQSLKKLRELDQELQENPFLESYKDFRCQIGEACKELLDFLPQRVKSFIHEIGEDDVKVERKDGKEIWTLSTAEAYYYCHMEGEIV